MTIKTEKGEIRINSDIKGLLERTPWDGVQGVVISGNGEFHGVKRAQSARIRKDGVTVGQVYAGGPNVKFTVENGTLENGARVSFMLIHPVESEKELPMMPGRLKSGEWIDAGYYLGIPPAVFAWQVGLKDVNTARLVQRAAANPYPAAVAKTVGLVRFPNTPCEPWVHPPIQQVRLIHHPITKVAVKKHLGLCVAFDSFDKWRKVLGWRGTEGAAAVWQFRASMGGPEHQILLTHFGELIREVIEPGSERWAEWEV